MEFTPLDLRTWNRREHFQHYLREAPCGYSLTRRLDVTERMERAKAGGRRFYPTILWAVATVCNRHAECRMALRDGAPGNFSMDDADLLDSSLGFPAAEAGKIDGAASLVHMMNLNTFTCGAFHVKDSGDVAALCASLRENILDRHWMCGFPDKLVIVTVGDYVVSVYGYTDLVDTFTAKLAAAYPSAKTVSDDPIV